MSFPKAFTSFLFEARPSRYVLGLCLSASLLATAQAQTAPKATPAAPAIKAAASKPRAAAKAEKSAATEGFKVAAAPAWVQAVTVDPALIEKLPKAALHVLLIDRQVRVDGNQASRFEHVIRQVNESSGLETAAQMQIEFDPSFETLTLHKIDLWRNGARIDRLDRKKVKVLQRETQLERQMVDGRLTASVVLDDVRVGDRVEFAYTVSGSNPVFEGKFVDTDWTVSSRGPVAQAQYRLLAPESRAIQVRAAPDRHVLTSQVVNGWRETLIRRHSAPRYQYDPNLPMRAEMPDQIQVSEFADWAAVAAWATRVFAPAYDVASAELRAQSDLLRGEPGSSPQEQVRRTLNFVQSEVRYFGTEIGPNTHRPALPDKVLQQRFGDCKDKVSLLIALLNAQGISAQPLLVSSYLRRDVDGMLPSPLAFNHVVARVSVGEKTWVLDGTRSMQKGPLDERQANILGRGLLARADETALLALPDTTADLRVEVNDKLVFAKISDDPVLEAEITYFGDMAENVRAILAGSSAEEFTRQMTADYARIYQTVEPVGELRSEEVADHNALRIQRQFKLLRYLRLNEQQQLAGDWGFFALMQPLRLADQTQRTQPLQLGYAGIYRQNLEFKFPEDIFRREGSQNFDEVNPRFEMHVHHEGKLSSVRLTGEVRMLTETLEPSDLSAHREKLSKAWPRLSGTMTIPSLSLAQGEKLSERLRAVAEEARKGNSKAKTEAQAEAQVQLMLAQARLASGRLSAHNRVRVLVDQGVQLDHLSRAVEATSSLEEALALEPENGDTHAALSVNALMRRQDPKAIEHASKALALAPNDTAPRYTRAIAQYYSGQVEPARDDLLAALKNRADVDRSYAALWLFVATRKLGGDGVAAVRDYLPHDAKPAWPYSVLQMFNGSGTFEQALAAARSDKAAASGRLCELYFFLGQQQLANGQPKQARESFQKSIDTGVSEFTEYALAQRELAVITAAK
jgi:lipoprotein NlpI/transglutaminase-like putative cysteine protease